MLASMRNEQRESGRSVNISAKVREHRRRGAPRRQMWPLFGRGYESTVWQDANWISASTLCPLQQSHCMCRGHSQLPCGSKAVGTRRVPAPLSLGSTTGELLKTLSG